jgi:hypothetical protein
MIFREFLVFVSTSIIASPLRAVLWLAAITFFLVLLFTNSETRLISATLFCLLAPGYGWARRMPANSPGDTLALAVVLSICITILVATAMAVLDAWVPVIGFVILTVVAIVGFLPLRPSQPAHRQDDLAGSGR